ncbi:MAG TPA: cyclic nucleotide-binding domain-containing protein, partial [Myxococcota bacterium]
DGPAIVGEPLSDSGAAIDAIDDRIDDAVEDLIAAAVVPRYADPAAGQIVSSADEVGDLGFAPAHDDVEHADDDDDVLDLDDSDIASAQIDVDRVPPIPLFSDLPRDAFVALTERMELRIASPGQRLIVESEPGVSMFVIIQGAVQVVRSDGHGNEVQLAQLGDGTFFGEMALLSDAPRTASVVVTEEAMLFEISRDLVEDMIAQYPSVGEVMKKFHRNRLITNLLKTSPVFAPFSTNDKKELIEKFKSRDVAAGTFLLTRQQPRDGLYVVLSGRCEVLDTVGPGAEEVPIAELREGDVFGEMSMLWNKETSASVRALTSCTVLRLPRASFSEVIMTHPQILETLSALSEQRLKHNLDLKAAAIASDFLL